MKPAWEALGARARGLSTHLLDEAKVGVLERSADVAELLRQLRGTPYERWLPTYEGAPGVIETAVSRSLADRMSTLGRWAGADPRALGAIFLEQDARNVRIILRDVVGGAAGGQHLPSLLPTPLLDRRALEALARAESAGALAATLVGWGHPLGSALVEEAGRTHPDLLRVEVALAQRLAAESLAAAKRAGRRVTDFVRAGLDADNAITALLLAGNRSEGSALDYFVEGGAALDRDAFARAATAPDRSRAAEILGRALGDSALAGALAEPPPTPSAVASRMAVARIAQMTGLARVDPLSAAPVLLFLLRLRREAWLVRRALWRAALTGGRRA